MPSSFNSTLKGAPFYRLSGMRRVQEGHRGHVVLQGAALHWPQLLSKRPLQVASPQAPHEVRHLDAIELRQGLPGRTQTRGRGSKGR